VISSFLTNEFRIYGLLRHILSIPADVTIDTLELDVLEDDVVRAELDVDDDEDEEEEDDDDDDCCLVNVLPVDPDGFSTARTFVAVPYGTFHTIPSSFKCNPSP
jgi:hypothetical protein